MSRMGSKKNNKKNTNIQNEIFHEVYGKYFQSVAEILKLAIDKKLDKKKINNISTNVIGFCATEISIPDKLKENKWKLLLSDYTTPIKHEPTMPLTILEKRWLKTLLNDQRLRLFMEDKAIAEANRDLADVEPLFAEKDMVFFDRYNDGDDFTDEQYIKKFRLLMQAVETKHKVHIVYQEQPGDAEICPDVVPVNLEYSLRDDRFCLQCIYKEEYLNLDLQNINIVNSSDSITTDERCFISPKLEHLEILVKNERNTLERISFHFADLTKETTRLDKDNYQLQIFYDLRDEHEIIRRILSFGPTIKLQGPGRFIALIQEQLKKQLQYQQQR